MADAGYGNSGALREGLVERELRYVVGVAPETVVFAQQPRWKIPDWGRRGKFPTRWVLTGDWPRPVAVGALAGQLQRHWVPRREGTKGTLSAPLAWVRVWPGANWHRGMRVPPEPVWLLVEEQPGDVLKFALSNLPPKTSLYEAVRLWKQRWRVEQGHQQMKEELGLDHFEGRSWRGFHHHAAMVILAYGFLLLEQTHPGREPARWRKKGDTEPPLTVPGIRRALQRLPLPAGETRLPLLPRPILAASNGVVLTTRTSARFRRVSFSDTQRDSKFTQAHVTSRGLVTPIFPEIMGFDRDLEK